MRKRHTDIINRSVNHWFHTAKQDGTSPENSIRKFSDLFLAAVNRMNFQLTCTPMQFRRNMCESLCVMFMAHKQQTGWYGPNSDAPRPEGWTDGLESEWKDLLRSMYFTYSFFENLWNQINEGEWEKSLPYWRVNMESIAFHYIGIRPELLDCPDIVQRVDNDHHPSAPVAQPSFPEYDDDYY